MTKYIAFIGFIVTTCLMAACSSSDMPIQHADDYDYITFSAQTEKVTSRTNPYEDYSPSKHPSTMGVFGYHDLSTRDESSTANTIFDNETTTYNTASTNWQTANQKKWHDYSSAKTFDFFAYMPQLSGAKVTNNTLTIPFSMPTGSCYLTNTQQAPIICALPDHKQATTADGTELAFERVVKLQFDQTLTAYQFHFMLDSKMNAIRQFHLKKVTFSGDIATSGTITRSYAFANGQWTAGNIQWTNLTKDTKEYEITSATTEPLLINSSGYTQWGETLYMIPDADFQPTITATYDVEMLAEDGTTIITRKDVTSSIILNKTNFSSLTAGGTAMINPIRILIQPRYLYVLSDDDAYTGHLLIE